MALIHTSPELREIHEKRKAGTGRMYWEPIRLGGVSLPGWLPLALIVSIVAAALVWLLF